MQMNAIKVESETPSKITLSFVCPLCGKKNTLEFEKTPEFIFGLKRYYIDGATVQSAFPMLSRDQREFFLTGNCQCIWGMLD